MSGLIDISKAAADRMVDMLEKRGTPNAYVRVGIKTAGCSGLRYRLEYADEPDIGDEKVDAHGANVIIDAKALIYLIGTIIDYEVDELRSGFTFTNPNKKGECGCGESFTV
jgi:iron-sulfur cluster assembly protein